MFKDLKSEEEKISYCLGLDTASRIMNLPIQLDIKAFVDAMTAQLSPDKKPDISQDEFSTLMNKFVKKIEEKRQEQMASHSAAKENGDKFRAEYAKNPNVKSTPSGLLYEILKEGNGKKPQATHTVKVHYEGTLIDGKVFDSSYQRNEPIEFPLNRVIAGWTEGLQLVSIGGKIKLVIPPELGYGKHGAGADIPPNSTLVFTVELLDFR